MGANGAGHLSYRMSLWVLHVSRIVLHVITLPISHRNCHSMDSFLYPFHYVPSSIDNSVITCGRAVKEVSMLHALIQ